MTARKNHKIICADFKIVILKTIHNEYLFLLLSFNFTNLINSPTRFGAESASALDHILCNFTTEGGTYCVVDVYLTDHSPIVLLTSEPVHQSLNDELSCSIKKLNNKTLRRLLVTANFNGMTDADVNTMVVFIIYSVNV